MKDPSTKCSSIPLILSIAAIVLSTMAYQRSHSEPMARSAYDVLSRVVEKNSKSGADNYEEISALKNHIDGLEKGTGLCAPKHEQESIPTEEENSPTEEEFEDPELDEPEPLDTSTLQSHDPLQSRIRPKVWTRRDIDVEMKLSEDP